MVQVICSSYAGAIHQGCFQLRLARSEPEPIPHSLWKKRSSRMFTFSLWHFLFRILYSGDLLMRLHFQPSITAGTVTWGNPKPLEKPTRNELAEPSSQLPKGANTKQHQSISSFFSLLHLAASLDHFRPSWTAQPLRSTQHSANNSKENGNMGDYHQLWKVKIDDHSHRC